MSDSSNFVRVEVPVLHTPRLTLRAHRPVDLEAATAMWTAPGFTRFMGGRPSSRQQTWTRFHRYIGHWALCGFGYWAVEENETGRFVGELGFSEPMDATPPSREGVPELGWLVAPSVQRQGYATEGVGAAIAWADRALERPRTACIINYKDEASLRIARRFGFRQIDQSTWFDPPRYEFDPRELLERIRASP